MDGTSAVLALFVLPALGGCGLYVSMRLERPESVRRGAIAATAAAFAALLWIGGRESPESTESALAHRLAGTIAIASAVVLIAARRTVVSAGAFLALAGALAMMLAAQGAPIAASGALVILAGAVGAPLLAVVRRGDLSIAAEQAGAADAGAATPRRDRAQENGLESELLLACVAAAMLVAVLAGGVHSAFAAKGGDDTAVSPSVPRRASDAVADDNRSGSFAAELFGGRTMLAEAVAVLFLATAAGVVVILRRDERT